MKNNLKIAYLSRRDPDDKREWSGTLYYTKSALAKNVGTVINLGPFDPRFTSLLLRLSRIFHRLFLHKNYNFAYSSLLTKVSARYFDKKIAREKPDVVIAVASTPFTAKMKTKVPLILVDDINFSQLLNYYANFTNLTHKMVERGHELTAQAYKNASAVVFSSGWSKDYTVKEYKIPQEKIHVISYGANLDTISSREEALCKEISDEVRLLFIGVDWYRKGGNLAFEAFRILHDKGVPVTLTVCGCIPPAEFKHEKMQVIPFLNKNNPNDFKKLYQLYLDTHFLIIPTRADCTPIVFCEANSFGVPVITTDTGGVSAVIENHKNGILHKMDDSSEMYADSIKDYFNNPLKYKKLVESSRDIYEKRLNWDSWAESIKKLITEIKNK